MRLNQYLARNTPLSRRAADKAIEQGEVHVNGVPSLLGATVEPSTDVVTFRGDIIKPTSQSETVLFNKPVGYVCSRNGQGSNTIYDILPEKYHSLNPAGRLDKDSSGLLVLTSDGDLAQELTHPRYEKIKIYLVTLNKPLEPLHQQMINDHGIQLEDGTSKLQLEKLDDIGKKFRITMREGRNRQIRRTFGALSYNITKLHRIQFGEYVLKDLPAGKVKEVN